MERALRYLHANAHQRVPVILWERIIRHDMDVAENVHAIEVPLTFIQRFLTERLTRLTRLNRQHFANDRFFDPIRSTDEYLAHDRARARNHVELNTCLPCLGVEVEIPIDLRMWVPAIVQRRADRVRRCAEQKPIERFNRRGAVRRAGAPDWE